MIKPTLLFFGLSLSLGSLHAKDPVKATPWIAEGKVKNLVSISVGDNGDVYVSESTRRKAADLDIRKHQAWIPTDVSLGTIDEKREFYHRELSKENSEKNKNWLTDNNRDGFHDWKDLTTLSEKIHLLQDTNKDGKADKVTLYADNFNTEVTGISAGILIHEGEVYTTIAPDVWKLKDTNQDGRADKRTSIAHGFGVHIAYAGHDMHGLTVGPDGKIYWSIGDKGLSVKDKNGKRHHYPNQGAVLRCNPDGSDFEVFAHGLRNVQELAFDEYGNLFGVDNDSDRKGEKERFVYITRGSDAGWRCNYQYRGADYNPWMKENLSIPYHEGQASYIVPPISSYLDGPTGFAYNPGTALNKSYAKHFFMTQFPKKNLVAFKVESVGASFKMTESESIFEGINLTGLSFGPEGELWGSDWGGGYALNDKGGVWKIDVKEDAKDHARYSTKTWLQKDYSLTAPSELISALDHLDQRVRLKAQFEMVRRDLEAELIQVSQSNSVSLLSRVHAIWGLGQIARTASDKKALQQLIKLLADSNPEILSQACKTLADIHQIDINGDHFVHLINHSSKRVSFFAALALAKHPATNEEKTLSKLIKLITNSKSNEVYIRHAVSSALSGTISAKMLAQLNNHSEPKVKLAAIVALRKQKSPEVIEFLKDKNELVRTEAARAIHDDYSIQDALPALANLTNTTMTSPALWRRVLNANFRLGLNNYAENLVKFASDESNETLQRLEAIQLLNEWLEPKWADRVTGRAREVFSRDLTYFKSLMKGYLKSMIQSSNSEIQSASALLSTKLNIKADPKTLLSWLKDTERDLKSRLDSLQLLFSHHRYSNEAVQIALTSNVPELRTKAACLLVKKDVSLGIQDAKKILDKGSIWEKQQIIQALSTLDDKKSSQTIEKMLIKLVAGKQKKELAYDLIQASEKMGFDEYREQYYSKLKQSDPTMGQYQPLAYGGDKELGKKIFNEHIAAQCIRCHALGGVGSAVGPDLKGVAKRFKPDYLLESLIKPAAKIAQGFGITTVTLKNDSFIAGTLQSENKTTLVIKTPDGSNKELKRSEIKSQTPVMSMMPSMHGILKDHEIRDVMAFLNSLKE